MEAPENTENALAGLLTGTMVTLIGAIVPGAVLWFMATHWDVVTSGAKVMSWSEALMGTNATVLSVGVFRYGLKILKLNAAALKRRPRTTA